jgi:hypothetical protein
MKPLAEFSVRKQKALNMLDLHHRRNFGKERNDYDVFFIRRIKPHPLPACSNSFSNP